MSKVTVAIVQRSRWQALAGRLLDSLSLWPDDVRRRSRIRKARSNRNLVFGRQSLSSRGHSSNAVVIRNKSPAVGVVERNLATRESPD